MLRGAGFKPVEFEKGMTAVLVKKFEDMPAVIDAIIAMVEKGDLDEQLKPAKKVPGTGSSAAAKKPAKENVGTSAIKRAMASVTKAREKTS